MLKTRFTELVGCKRPLQEAGMGQLGTPRLAAAVAEAGALGMVGWGGAPPEHVAKWLEEVRRATTGVFGMNFLVPSVRDDATGEIDPTVLAAVVEAASRARVVEFFYADPDVSLVETAHEGGALVSWQVGSLAEAVAAEHVGCDLIVAQGTEAGGHVRGRIGLFALLAEVLPSVKIPVVAAGGIGTGRAMAAALAAGASAVRVGTRFVAATESDAHPRWVQRLIAAKAEDTVLTEAFSTNWPNAPHRVLRSCVDALRESRAEMVGDRVYQWALDRRVPVPRGAPIVPMRTTSGDIDAMPHWAGESVDGVEAIVPAREIVTEMCDVAENLLRLWSS